MKRTSKSDLTKRIFGYEVLGSSALVLLRWTDEIFHLPAKLLGGSRPAR